MRLDSLYIYIHFIVSSGVLCISVTTFTFIFFFFPCGPVPVLGLVVGSLSLEAAYSICGCGVMEEG